MKYFFYFLFLLSSLQGDAFKEGIESIKQKDYSQASDHFHLAAKSGNSAALFGEAICLIALGKHEIAAEHLQKLVVHNENSRCNFCVKAAQITDRELLRINSIRSNSRSAISASFHAKNCTENFHYGPLACASCDQEEQNLPPAKTTEEEQISAYNCRQRVRKVTKELRYLVEKLVADTVPGFFQKIRTFRQLNPYIDNLERNGLACCQNQQNGNGCTEPLVEQLKLWNSEGLPVKESTK